jgi:predicted MFS family arabinose efflux permease
MIKQTARLYTQAVSGLPVEVWILSIASFINRSGAMVLAFTTLYLTNELHFNLAEAGLIMGFYGVGSMMGSYTGGALADRRPYNAVMLFSLISSSLVLLLLLVITSYWGIATVIMAYAFLADMFRPANAAAITVYSDATNRTRAVSLMRLSVNLGFSVGPAAGGLIAHQLGYSWLFILDACTALLAAGLLWWKLPPTGQHVSPKNDVASTPIRTRSAYRDWPYLSFILLTALYAMSFFQLFSGVPQYLSQEGKLSEDTIGLLLALNGLLVVLIELPFVAALSARKNSIFHYIIIGTCMLPPAYLAFAWGGPTIIAAAVYIVLATASEIFAMPFMMNYAISRPPASRKGQYAALYSISYGLALTAAPAGGLWLAEQFGFTNYFYLIAGATILLALAFYKLRHAMLAPPAELDS